jgi:SagB-type dehydrogenase family enzyme
VGSLSRLLFDSLALSAWKSAGGEAWALRVNPSSGNLHPTEGYVICGHVRGLAQTPVICHYAPKEHALELRCELSLPLWEKLGSGFPLGALFVALTSIHWREAWKYGERAYRYCQLDVGHALAAVSIAAGGLGWRANLVDAPGAEELARLLGVSDPGTAEPEDPDCLIAVYPQEHEGGIESGDLVSLAPEELLEDLTPLTWQGKPNVLSRSHVNWEAIVDVAKAARKPHAPNCDYGHGTTDSHENDQPSRQISLRRIIHQRRSAVAMDDITSMNRETFYRMLLATLPASGRVPFGTLPWHPRIDLALFVHRVNGLAPGLYFLVRNPGHMVSLRAAMPMHPKFEWRKPDGCPEQLELYLLGEGDVRRISAQISCFQDIAGEGCFSAAMIADFEPSLKQCGAWFYPRLFWECGMIGQVLYLEAEAAGLRGTGIGCFFDDPTHELLGLSDKRYQDLYHFTIGGPVEDRRITTLPAYPS